MPLIWVSILYESRMEKQDLQVGKMMTEVYFWNQLDAGAETKTKTKPRYESRKMAFKPEIRVKIRLKQCRTNLE